MGKKLYVGNLPFAATEDDLAEVFGQIGPVESVKIVTDRETGRSKGFCFVEMGTEVQAIDAMKKLNGTMMGGRTLTVNEARPMERRRGEEPGSSMGHIRSYRSDPSMNRRGSRF